MDKFVRKALYGEMDSDRHLISIYAIALASRGKTYVELGVREGHTSEPLYEAAKSNDGKLWSVDLNQPTEYAPTTDGQKDTKHYEFVQSDSIKFLEEWPKDYKMDVVFVDDWHYLMYGNTDPFYHVDLAHGGPQWEGGGPYRAVAELNPQFWEWSTLPWNNGLTILRKKYSNKYHRR